jgi:hypothetical protein
MMLVPMMNVKLIVVVTSLQRIATITTNYRCDHNTGCTNKQISCNDQNECTKDGLSVMIMMLVQLIHVILKLHANTNLSSVMIGTFVRPINVLKDLVFSLT